MRRVSLFSSSARVLIIIQIKLRVIIIIITTFSFYFGQNAEAGLKGCFAVVLCGNMCFWDETRVLPKDRGGVVELCSNWDEHHPKPLNPGR